MLNICSQDMEAVNNGIIRSEKGWTGIFSAKDRAAAVSGKRPHGGDALLFGLGLRSTTCRS